MRLDFRRQTGTYVGRGQGALTATDTFFGTEPFDRFGIVDLGYIQFGGLTAGRVQSFFDFWANDGIYTTLNGVSDTKTQALAYTATFGSGFSATLAIEDAQERRTLAAVRPLNFGAPFVPVVATALDPVEVVPGGTRAPDVVANLRVDQAWGAAQLSAALHQVRSINPVTVDPVTGLPIVGIAPVPDAAIGTTFPDNELGYAIQGGVQVKMPFIAAGDSLWVQAAWAHGALGYTHAAPFTAARAGVLRLNQTEATMNPFTGDIELTDSWSISANFLHYWLPNLRQNIFAAYSEIDYDATASRAFVAPGPGGFPVVVNSGFTDTKIFEIGTNLIWSPVRNLDIGVEAVYRKVETEGLVRREFGGVGFGANRPVTAAVPFTAVSDQDALEARLRIQREF
ncbi:MAG TPA: porin [Beijerinckiaceae bacterium]|nr:porin [Beijerinckiaceae bacterium]